MVVYGLCSSRAEAARLVGSRAVTVSLRPMKDPRNELKRDDMIDGRLIVVKSGKKGWLVFYVED
jgi:tyrosyl-tRNA synthetase